MANQQRVYRRFLDAFVDGGLLHASAQAPLDNWSILVPDLSNPPVSATSNGMGPGGAGPSRGLPQHAGPGPVPRRESSRRALQERRRPGGRSWYSHGDGSGLPEFEWRDVPITIGVVTRVHRPASRTARSGRAVAPDRCCVRRMPQSHRHRGADRTAPVWCRRRNGEGYKADAGDQRQAGWSGRLSNPDRGKKTGGHIPRQAGDWPRSQLHKRLARGTERDAPALRRSSCDLVLDFEGVLHLAMVPLGPERKVRPVSTSSALIRSRLPAHRDCR